MNLLFAYYISVGGIDILDAAGTRSNGIWLLFLSDHGWSGEVL